MATKTQKKNPEEQLRFEDLYNLIMHDIEQELCTDMIPHLEEIYKDENKEDRIERFAHYSQCFKIFLVVLKEVLNDTEEEILAFKHDFVEKMKGKVKDIEKANLSEIEHSLDDEIDA
jgi:hypothetical protein